MSESAYIQSLLNRTDLSIVSGFMEDPYTAAAMPGGGSLPGYLPNAPGVGQASLGVLALLIVGLAGFYLWTRSHQK